MRIEIRTTPEEKRRWQEIAENKGVSLSELVRSALGGQRLRKRREPPRVDPDLLRELARLGRTTVSLDETDVPLLDVLAVYVILLASVPFLVPLMLRYPVGFAAGSFVLWCFAPVLNAFVPNHRLGGLLFNPFGWQMLFFSGIAMGLFRKQVMPVLMQYRRLLTVLSTGMFLFGTAIIIGAKIGEPALAFRDALRLIYGGEIGKWDLDGTRYMAIMGASWLVAVPLAGIMERMAASRLGVALQQIGRGGLFSFLACVLLSVLGDAFQMNPADQGILRRMAVDVWTMVALWWVSALWLTYGTPWQLSVRLRRQAKG